MEKKVAEYIVDYFLERQNAIGFSGTYKLREECEYLLNTIVGCLNEECGKNYSHERSFMVDEDVKSKIMERISVIVDLIRG